MYYNLLQNWQKTLSVEMYRKINLSCLLLRSQLFTDFCQINYLQIYRTDLRQIFRFGRTAAVDDQSEVSFLFRQGALP